MRILVTGATGFVGRHVVPALVEAGHAVRCFHRPTSDRSPLQGLDVELVPGDVRMPATVARAVEGMEAVVHLVAILREADATFEEVNVVGVHHVAAAAADAGADRAVHLGALGTSERHPTRYARTKARGERVWREGEVPYVILRPSLILGPGASFGERLADLVRRYEKVPVVGSGQNVLQPVCVGDVVDAVLATLEAEPRRTHELVGPERLTWDAFVLRAADAMGLDRSLRHVPPLLARMVARLSGLTGEPVVTRDELHLMQQDLVGDPAVLERLVGRPPTPLDRCLPATFPGDASPG